MFWGQEPMTHRLLLGVNFGRWIFLGIIEGPKDFSFWFLTQFNHPRHLESAVTPPPHSPPLPGMQRGYNIYSHTPKYTYLREHRKLTLPLRPWKIVKRDGINFWRFKILLWRSNFLFLKTRKENYVLVLFLSDNELKVLLTIQARWI